MAVANAVPTGDVVKEWSSPAAGTHFDDIDEGIAGGSGADFIGATNASGDDLDIDDFSFGDLVGDPAIDEITQVVVHTNGWTAPAVDLPDPDVDLFFGGAWMSATVGWKACGFNGDRKWTSATYAGLSGDQDDMDDLRVRVRADCANKMQGCYVHTIYVAVTYSVLVGGYTHDIGGVPAANIGSVIGVPTANIASIIGV